MSERLAPRGSGALVVRQLVVKQAEVHQEGEAGPNAGGAELGHVALDEPQLHAGVARPLARAP
jgi:hypothetical protein